MLNNNKLEITCQFTRWEYFVVCRTLLIRNTKESRRIARELIATFIEDSIENNNQDTDIYDAIQDLVKQFNLNIKQTKIKAI